VLFRGGREGRVQRQVLIRASCRGLLSDAAWLAGTPGGSALVFPRVVVARLRRHRQPPFPSETEGLALGSVPGPQNGLEANEKLLDRVGLWQGIELGRALANPVAQFRIAGRQQDADCGIA
jgi:hypothetical protein